MKALAIAKDLEKTFAKRSLSTHASDRAVKRFPHGDHSPILVLDLAVSREILLSKSFSSFNYFDEGLRHLKSSGVPVAHVRHFFRDGMLFTEGPEHHAIKQAALRLLQQSSEIIGESAPRLERFFLKRKEVVKDPWTFSKLFVRLCMAFVVARLTALPMLQVHRSLLKRHNVFYFYFHAVRHKRMDAVLSRLSGTTPAEQSNVRDRAVYILVQSLVMMGYDPLVGSLCASLIEGNADVASGPWRYCPTSFVSRICVDGATVGGHQFSCGDVCYLSLLPAPGEHARTTFPFGLGTHACVGKRFSLTVLKTAGDIATRIFPRGFEKVPEIQADGAFLGFRLN